MYWLCGLRLAPPLRRETSKMMTFFASPSSGMLKHWIISSDRICSCKNFAGVTTKGPRSDPVIPRLEIMFLRFADASYEASKADRMTLSPAAVSSGPTLGGYPQVHRIAHLPMRPACALPFPLLLHFNRFLLFFVFACTCASTALDFTLTCNLHLCVLPRWCVLFCLCALHVYALAVRYIHCCFMLCMAPTLVRA